RGISGSRHGYAFRQGARDTSGRTGTRADGGEMTFDRPASEDLDALLNCLPAELQRRVRALEGLDELLEIVMDLGRTPEARFAGREEVLSDNDVSAEDLAYVTARIGHFGDDNRAGSERTLHRISALRNRAGKLIGV